MVGMVPYDRYGRTLSKGFPWDTFDDFFSAPMAALSGSDAFKMDVEDAGDTYVISAELPGVKKDEIDVELNEGRLSISVDKKESEENKDKNFIHKETHEWKASRGVYLKDAATAGLSASYNNGVLEVKVPKQQEKANACKVTID